MIKIFLLDNYDSFTYNLAGLLKSIQDVKVDVRTPKDIDFKGLGEYDKIIFSPGPGIPSEFPVMREILSKYSSEKSILGICLGHQMIGEYFGATLSNLDRVNHGWVKKLNILSHNSIIYNGIQTGTEIGVYHSWYLSRNNFPDCLRITAECNEGLIMSLEHRSYDIQSVQFHPESFITKQGYKMIHNWVISGKSPK